jgi:hypothetical protein
MVAAEILAGWLPGRITGPVVVVAGPLVVDATVVVVGPVVGGPLCQPPVRRIELPIH